ncbi:hypothetical protein BHU72_03665 [Desulfuribacillus stibiiarsenatis]|uniref:FtsK domain-containing protein n=1 Tax=Desulfuribacillus stibiiarsenatis TaxID=1390249 RepID=A0A1E5L6U4_9FIRM|nr:DNA translocase FtsK [Desulfuribacillus stibiiarsenatis]OEH85882.1 hypothetical protein BHU72_03665 [Desulfuribacillus stibiiarsenatis]
MEFFKELNRNLKYESIGIIILVISALTLGKFGSIGGSLAFLTKLIAGNWGFLLPLFAGAFALYLMIHRSTVKPNTRFYGVFLFFLILLIYSHLNLYVQLLGKTGSDFNIISSTYVATIENRVTEESVDLGGGLIGALLLWGFIYLFDVNGTKLVLLGSFLIALLFFTKLSIGDVFKNIKIRVGNLRDQCGNYFSKLFDIMKKDINKNDQIDSKTHESTDKNSYIHETKNVNQVTKDHFITAETQQDETEKDVVATKLEDKAVTARKFEKEEVLKDLEAVLAVDNKPLAGLTNMSYDFPPLQLLQQRATKSKGDAGIVANIRKLEATLESFGVVAKVVQYSQGPAVTRYELQPAIGVKVSKILNLTDDLALALAAKDIRMEAPIPGKAAIGIEVPNQEVAVIGLKEVLESKEFKQANSKLTIALGKDLSGNSIVADLAKMPHLLVAGSTGSGKSVCVNGIITSILYKANPDEVKFFMIDPKMVELNVYNDIPHLVTPVVTDPRQAAYMLKRVVQEMERRYRLFADRKTRDLERYNTIIRQEIEKGNHNLECLPQIVVIIDELADLMMVAPGDVEDAICRIAQMARAAGIHLIIATQRPSVDVITGIIKANIPSRISFAVASQTDSRTILDMGGAEKLLGRGDMLFYPVGASKPVRIQGAYIAEEEIEAVVDFIKKQKEATYNEELLKFDSVTEEKEASNAIEDELYPQAVELILEVGQASVSFLQRKLKVGYARAARLIDSMEENGVVGPFEGSKPRDVLLTKDEYYHIKEQQKANLEN